MSNPIKKTISKTNSKIQKVSPTKVARKEVLDNTSTHPATTKRNGKKVISTQTARAKSVSKAPIKGTSQKTSKIKSKPKVSVSKKSEGTMYPGLCDEMALIKLADINKIINIDKAVLSTARTFAADNQYSYWLLLNTWFFQVSEVSQYGYIDLKDQITRYGLVQTIKECSALSDNFIRECSDTPGDYFSPIVSSSFPAYLYSIVSGCVDLKQVLQLLRYPKRFCPARADLLKDRGIASFLDVNRNCREINNLMYGETYATVLSRRLKPYITEMLKGINVDFQRGFFSNGAAYNAGRSFASKLTAFSQDNPNILDQHYPLMGFHNFVPKTDKQEYSCKLEAVPKSYKTPRIIAMEPATRQFYMQAIRLAIEDALIRNHYDQYFDVHDQSGNRNECFSGSISGDYSTVDLTSASDSLSRALVWRLFPGDLFTQMYTYLSKYVVLPSGESRIIHMFSTSGSALTFCVEAIVFLSILLLANDLYRLHTGITPLKPKIFGDDAVVDTRVFQTFCDLLTELGFTVNISKSFNGDTGYRESCGVEYSHGLDTCTKYFPRNELRWRKQDMADTLSSLISLQHRLYACVANRHFLTKFVRFLEPRMTSHSPGTECVDLWEVVPQFEKAQAPRETKPRVALTKRQLERNQLSAIKINAIYQREKDLCRKWAKCESMRIECTVPPEEWSLREKHLALVEQPSKMTGSLTRELVQDLEMFRYRDFLRQGPSYDDELLRLLRVSRKPKSLLSDVNIPGNRWDYIKE